MKEQTGQDNCKGGSRVGYVGHDLGRDLQAGIYIGILCMNVVVWEEQ